MASPFNDYDADGFRINRRGSRTSRIADEAIIRNLRYRWPKELSEISDAELVNEYDDFALSDQWGNNDENFLAWIDARIPEAE